MPHFNFIKESKCNKTFRVASVMGKFDLQENHICQKFTGNIDIENKDWQIGLIVGKSGTGKTSIAKELFNSNIINGFDYNKECLLDDMPQSKSIDEITKTFNSVGFSSPPNWLKSYHVLSTGEKMRVDLARAILENNDLFVFDEFTSVVDRQVAKIGSYAMQKAIRRSGKKFIAISCHYDVAEWLLPDWIFNTDSMDFQYFGNQKKNRPEINIQIRKSKSWSETKNVWRYFSKYHYLTTDINQNVTAFFMYANNDLCGFMAVMKFPHSIIKNYTKISRIVILPDYQGIGLSKILSEKIAEYYKNIGEIIIGGTSHPSIINYRKNSDKWICIKIGRGGKSSKAGSNYKSKILTELTGKNSKNIGINKLTTSWKYIG